MSKKIFLIGFLLLTTVGLIACQPEEASVTNLSYVVSEGTFKGPEQAAGGWTQFTVENRDESTYSLGIFKIPEDKSHKDIQAESAEGPPEWLDYYGQLEINGGDSKSLTTNLAPGKYTVEATLVEEEMPESPQPMVVTLTVSSQVNEVDETVLPVVTVNIDMKDFAFGAIGEIKAGEQTVRFSNTGKEAHALLIARLKEGKTMADVQATIERETNGEEVPEEDIPFERPEIMAVLAAGVTNYVERSFEPGNYVFFCPFPSPTNEMAPHYMLGMMQPVTVRN